jgi:hypothetical protein
MRSCQPGHDNLYPYALADSPVVTLSSIAST